MTHDQTSAVLSFCLPGLGQLHQRRVGVTGATFGVFCGLSLSQTTRCFIPIWAAAVGWEALINGSPPQEIPQATARRRKIVFAAFGVFGFCFWFLMVVGNFLPVGSQMDSNHSAAVMAQAIRNCRQQNASWPETLKECPAASQLTDAFGNPFVYRRTERGFELRSAGRDGRSGTADDFIFQYR